MPEPCKSTREAIYLDSDGVRASHINTQQTNFIY